MSQTAHVRNRGGFTLIEMLIVITIIGMLMGMTSFAIWKVIQNARVAKIMVEIDQLAQSIQGYKQTRIQYPPCMGTISVTDRKTALLRHISMAYTNASYGSSAADFDKLRNRILNTSTSDWGYNYSSSGTITGLDLNNLDQAEALVFWLGGFPTPYSTATKAPIATRRLFGFHRDADNPWKRDTNYETPSPLQYRTDPEFSFDELRLVDNDGDGWLEYSPLVQRSGESTAPYVYFDSYTYGLSSNTTSTSWTHFAYPRPDNNGAVAPQAKALSERYGMASPMATYLDKTKVQPTRWANDTGIQIICAGLDGIYSDPLATSVTLTSAQRVPVFPGGYVYTGYPTFTVEGYYTRYDMDNQTNLSNKTLEGARGKAQK